MPRLTRCLPALAALLPLLWSAPPAAAQSGEGAGMPTMMAATDRPRPTVQLEVTPDAGVGWTIRLHTNHFVFTPWKVGGEHVSGEGYATLYIDDEPAARLYGRWYHLSRPLPGAHTLRVVLTTNAQALYEAEGGLIADSVTVTGDAVAGEEGAGQEATGSKDPVAKAPPMPAGKPPDAPDAAGAKAEAPAKDPVDAMAPPVQSAKPPDAPDTPPPKRGSAAKAPVSAKAPPVQAGKAPEPPEPAPGKPPEPPEASVKR